MRMEEEGVGPRARARARSRSPGYVGEGGGASPAGSCSYTMAAKRPYEI
jgi:hypothetical protein